MATPESAKIKDTMLAKKSEDLQSAVRMNDAPPFSTVLRSGGQSAAFLRFLEGHLEYSYMYWFVRDVKVYDEAKLLHVTKPILNHKRKKRERNTAATG